MRGVEWISVPYGQRADEFLPQALGLCINPNHAWLSDTIEQAIDRAHLIDHCWGYKTELRAIVLKSQISNKNHAHPKTTFET